MVEISNPLTTHGTSGIKGKGLASYYDFDNYMKSRLNFQLGRDWLRDIPSTPIPPPVATTTTIGLTRKPAIKSTLKPPPRNPRRKRPISASKYQLYENYANRYIPDDISEAPEQEEEEGPETAIPAFRTMHHHHSPQNNPPPTEVHVLMLTWAKHDRRGDDGQLLSPGLDIETETVRSCFKRRGYSVQCRVIPEDYPTSAVETMLDRFLAKSGEGVLLVVYYHGYGNMDVDGERMMFSRYVHFPYFLRFSTDVLTRSSS